MKIFMPRRSGPKPFSCCLCEKAYSTQFSLRRHFSQIHSDKPKISHENNQIIPRMVINARHYEKNKERLRNIRIRRKQYSMAHIELLKERICDIVDGLYDHYFPEKPAEPPEEDLNLQLSDPKILWKHYNDQLASYNNILNSLKHNLMEISWDQISERVSRKLNDLFVSNDNSNVQTDASSVGSSVESDRE